MIFLGTIVQHPSFMDKGATSGLGVLSTINYPTTNHGHDNRIVDL
jgi:hypothetical protein